MDPILCLKRPIVDFKMAPIGLVRQKSRRSTKNDLENSAGALQTLLFIHRMGDSSPNAIALDPVLAQQLLLVYPCIQAQA